MNDPKVFLLLVLVLLVLLIGSEIVRVLHSIRDAIRQNYQQSLQDAMNQQEIVVPGEKKEVKCVCGHRKLFHEFRHSPGICDYETGKGTCGCSAWRPNRGPWPSDPGRM